MSNDQLKQVREYRREGKKFLDQAEKLMKEGKFDLAKGKSRIASNCFKMANLIAMS